MTRFAKFTIVSERDVQALENTHQEILLNLNQIISVKPINIVVSGEVVQGFWIRMANGKKYRCIKVPEEISKLI